MIKAWIEAMRLRTLPVSVAGVIAGIACAVFLGKFNAVPAVLCVLFAMLAQIASNFGNEYYDFKNGVDKKGRDGFRRGVTEGEISPKAMKIATFFTLALAKRQEDTKPGMRGDPVSSEASAQQTLMSMSWS